MILLKTSKKILTNNEDGDFNSDLLKIDRTTNYKKIYEQMYS